MKSYFVCAPALQHLYAISNLHSSIRIPFWNLLCFFLWYKKFYGGIRNVCASVSVSLTNWKNFHFCIVPISSTAQSICSSAFTRYCVRKCIELESKGLTMWYGGIFCFLIENWLFSLTFDAVHCTMCDFFSIIKASYPKRVVLIEFARAILICVHTKIFTEYWDKSRLLAISTLYN